MARFTLIGGDDGEFVATVTYKDRYDNKWESRSITRAQAKALGARLLELAGEPVAPAKVELEPVGPEGKDGWFVKPANRPYLAGEGYYSTWVLDSLIANAEETYDEPFDVYMRVATVGAKPEVTREVVRFGK